MSEFEAYYARNRIAIREWVDRNPDAYSAAVRLTCEACGSTVAAGIVQPTVPAGERIEIPHAVPGFPPTVTSGPYTLDALAQFLRITPAATVVDGPAGAVHVWRCARCSSRRPTVVGAADAIERARSVWLDNAERRASDRRARLSLTLPTL